MDKSVSHVSQLASAARAVALAQTLPVEQWKQQAIFTVLDSTFDAGQVFFATWQRWCDHPRRPHQLHYLALLSSPWSIAELAEAHAAWPAWTRLARQLRALWPTLLPGYHRLYLDHNRVVLSLLIGNPEKCLGQLEARADAFLIHAAPAWPLPMLARLNRLAHCGTKLAMVDLDPAQQKTLEQAGFSFEKTAFGVPPDISPAIAYFSPRWQAIPPCIVTSSRHAIVIGAGLAGAAICQRLTLRGWNVTLIERHTDIAQETSGNTAGIFMPLLSRDDNQSTRLSRAAYLFARHVWEGLGGIGQAFSGASCGVLQIARDPEHAYQQQRWAQQVQHPANYAQWLTQPAASALLGTTASYGGWLFPGGGWVHPASLCRAMLESCGTRLESRFAASVDSLVQTPDGWQVCATDHSVIASAPVVILANGMGALDFPQATLPLTAIRGQVTYLDAGSAPTITQVLCGDGYLTPASRGVHSIGASYDEDLDPVVRQNSQDQNLARLQKILPGWKVDTHHLPLAGRVGFRCVSADRLPLVGALPDTCKRSVLREPKLNQVPRLSGLYGLLGLASRGLIWAPLAAELLAAQLNNEPLPIEKDLAAALDPARFLLRAQRCK